ILGDGWYRGRLGWQGVGGRNRYGSALALLAQLEIVYADGSRQVVCSDEHWRASGGPILASDLYDGETYDARLEMPGWDTAGFDDFGWQGVRFVERDLATLVAPTGPPARRTETLLPVKLITSPSGRTIVDFGQNLTGRLRFTVTGPAGATVTLRHAEVLEDGEICTRPLRTALATDHFTLKGGGIEHWEPRFTFHGFRYAEVSGWPGELDPSNIEAVVCHSDMERTGWFECSDPLINRLHENVVRSMRGNFLDVPTDCPQRDERFGWTGDLQVFAPAASYLYDVAGLLTSWLADLAADQLENGIVPVVVPNPLAHGDSRLSGLAAAAWGDAAVVVPWVLYRRFGDAGILEAQFESMRRWVDAVASIAGPGRLWDRGFQFADWLDPLAPPDEPGRAMTDPHLVATAYFARSAELLSHAAAVLGRAAEAQRYDRLAGEVRTAFRHEFATPGGRLASDTQTAYALALQFGLLESPEQRRRAGRRLASLVRHNRYRIGTGFVGTPLVLDALCEAGEHEIAFRMLCERDCPSWLYPVTMGATTIWERWDSLLPDGRVNPGQMTSFNHYALGAVADWLHRRIGGLAPLEPGYRRIEVRPLPGGGITWAKARLRTPYGLAACAWQLEHDALTLELTVPVNSSATVVPPGGGAPIEAGSGSHRWSLPL
ncbi:MAG TPA: family 78 glycoside hydrolase catalytic domain, partial [Dehalococcoidia bacterium]